MTDLAPIALFVYKRPRHTQQTLESLAANEGASESELFIFCDGPKRPEDEKAVEEVRRLVKSRQWCGKINIIERDKNLGLANSIISGVTELCDKYGRVIVLEDDLLTSRYFLEYMNAALERYENEERVMQISGYMFPVEIKAETDAIFLPFTTSWGWATWKRAWVVFDKDMSSFEILSKDKALRKAFDLDGSYPYFKMLESQRAGKIDSWAIRWYLSVFLKGGLTLYPAKTLINNIGFDGSGTHCTAVGKNISGKMEDFNPLTLPSRYIVSEEVFLKLKELFRGNRSFIDRAKRVIRNYFEKADNNV